MKRVIVVSAAAAVFAATVAFPAQAVPTTAEPAATTQYVVLYKDGAPAADAQKAIQAAGGTIVKVNPAVGLATVTTANPGFATALTGSAAIEGVAHDRPIGSVPKAARTSQAVQRAIQSKAVEKAGRGEGGPLEHGRSVKAEPLSDLQWDLRQIHADEAHKYEQGDRGVLVGVADTGIDGSHPDIAPNFDRTLSRNFTVDIPYDANGAVVDGPCEDEPDRSCNDPNDVDEDGHGTHVASSIASPINKLGIAGVAPKVTLVNLRAGQDSGFFFLQPSVDALTYAGDIGVDVLNMSYYIDPWLFNCADNPADSPADQAEQRTVIKATQRALDYAYRRGVTLVSAAGNGATDYTKTIVDAGSPDFASEPGEAPRTRTIPPSCVSMPSEGEHVISVSSTGVSKRKAYYSDYGDGYVDVASPGGDVYDTPGNTRDVTKATLAAYPKALAVANGEIDANGDPTVNYVVKDCDGATCGYYQYLQGTSMASPRATGVAALIVSRYGHRDPRHGGKTLSPAVVETVLKATATRTACPNPPAYTYTRVLPSGQTVTATHTCEGGRASNGFYGKGIVDALRAVGR
ncbi:serine protease [Sphaerisporangium krabiense]|uniref:Subtilisin family serine protease n=1 Tax=Sphaerisporangium krabiense TaxID=763782 RepID=A0A7W8YZ25_9ACTN|nr:S8 family serine peptidase [Sphaerisporangium krabiense]MBB5624395.1 subtilisin family serine protease [Sphaerisporangium krabiense]GII61650.1 serine protease [Sphaerisporangium krabiense]